MKRVAWGPVVALAVIFGSIPGTGCTLPDGLLEDRACPCLEGWYCGPAGVCVQGAAPDGGQPDAGDDAGGIDAGADGALDATLDGGLPMPPVACWTRPAGCDWTAPGARFVERADSTFSALGSISNPAFSPDGCVVFFGRGSPGDIYRVRRASAAEPFGAEQAVDELNREDVRDAHATVGPDLLEVLFTSNRDDPESRARIFRSRRLSPAAAWSIPELAMELDLPGYDLYDPHLAPHGLQFFFSPSAPGDQSLWVADRDDPSEAFGAPRRLPDPVGIGVGGMTTGLAEPATNFDGTLLVFIEAQEPRAFKMHYRTRDHWRGDFGDARRVPSEFTDTHDIYDMGLSPDGCELVVRSEDGQLVHLVYAD